MTELDQTIAEAVEILQHVKKLRDARPKKELIIASAAERFAKPLLPRGEPDFDGTIGDAYEKALRYWARAVARHITAAEWEKMVWAASDQVPEFRGDAVRFFETKFDSVTLKDGSSIHA